MELSALARDHPETEKVSSLRSGSVQCSRYRRLMDITVYHLIIDVDDAIEIAQQIDA